MGGHRRTAAVIGLLLAGLALGARAAGAQEGDPTVQGSVVGTLTQGSRVTFSVTATHPEGWGALRQVNVILTLRDVPLDQLEFHADDQAISTGGSRALLGTANVATGRFFRIAAVDVGLRTAGKRLVVTMRPQVIAEIPPGARFEFVAEDDFGESVSVGRVAPTVPDEDGGIPWGAAAVAVVGALAAGGLVGSRVAAHRRPARSIYATVHRKIEAQPYRRVAEARAPAAALEPPAQPGATGTRPTRSSAKPSSSRKRATSTARAGAKRTTKASRSKPSAGRRATTASGSKPSAAKGRGTKARTTSTRGGSSTPSARSRSGSGTARPSRTS